MFRVYGQFCDNVGHARPEWQPASHRSAMPHPAQGRYLCPDLDDVAHSTGSPNGHGRCPAHFGGARVGLPCDPFGVVNAGGEAKMFADRHLEHLLPASLVMAPLYEKMVAE